VTDPATADVAVHVRPAAAPALRRRSALEVAVILAAGLVLVSSVPLATGPLEPPRLLTFLLALGALCLAALATRRAPTIAWLASIGASYLAATLFFDEARSLVAGKGDQTVWLATAAGASLWAVATAWIGARYATRPGCRLDPVAVPVAVGIVGWLVVACLTTIGVVLAGQRTPDPAFTWVDVAIVPVGAYLPLVLALVGLGAAADVRAARDRAIDRLGPPSGSNGAERTWRLAAATGRELVPGHAAAVEAAQAAERTRIAGDLHASVLPTLRRAIAEAEAGGDPAVLAARLRTVDVELERLMADRWPVVLEAFGLVAALEDVAEALEAGGSPPISIDVERSGDRPPAAVERAAWRFAQVALDNAIRHAAPATILVTVAVEATTLRLAVTDDGAGLEPAIPVRPGARGLADATRRAADVGASVRVEPWAAGGTLATFDWTATRS
jgi:signal transduction histidine kinase